MKITILIMNLLFVFNIGFCQSHKDIFKWNGYNIEYDTVFDCGNMKSDYLYKKSTIWVADYFNNAKKVIESQITNETIIGNGIVDLGPYWGLLSISFKLLYKDGKCRVILNQINQVAPDGRILMNLSEYFQRKKIGKLTLKLGGKAKNEIDKFLYDINLMLHEKKYDEW